MSLRIEWRRDFEPGPKQEKYFDGAVSYILNKVGGKKDYQTEFQAIYSDTGLYFLFCCEDRTISCTFKRDGEDLYTEDVLEIFLQPEGRYPVYMEYELSPLNRELVLLVSHNGEKFYGWKPFHYTGVRRTKHITWAAEGEILSGGRCRAWKAMIYIPFALFEGAADRYPAKGSVWRGNVFRIDTDDNEISRYAYDAECGTEFHDCGKFAEIIFE